MHFQVCSMDESAVIVKKGQSFDFHGLTHFVLFQIKGILWNIVCLYTHMHAQTHKHCTHADCALLMPERVNEFYSYSVFKSVAFIGQCPLNMNNLAQEIRILWMGPKI
jgi:hypothetical protein